MCCEPLGGFLSASPQTESSGKPPRVTPDEADTGPAYAENRYDGTSLKGAQATSARSLS